MRWVPAAVLLSLAAIGTAAAQPPPWAGPPGAYPPGYTPGRPPPPPGYAPVPPPRNEFVPPPPGPRMIWEPGHWHWNGYQYIWIGGRYIPARPHYGQDVPGHWVMRNGGWVWVPAHWQ